jgi:hypothetical protein
MLNHSPVIEPVHVSSVHSPSSFFFLRKYSPSSFIWG